MNRKLQLFASELSHISWLESVGKLNTGYKSVESWQEAVALRRNIEWMTAQNRIRNKLRDLVFDNSRSRFNDWNKVIVEFEGLVNGWGINEKVALCGLTVESADFVMHHVRMDVVTLLQGQEYSEYGTLPILDEMRSIYTNGHFLCGWIGNYPDGEIVVY